jgi:hypothetical protein
MSPHLNTLSWFQANQSLLFLFKARCVLIKIAEKQQIPILMVFCLTRSGLELPIYYTRTEHANNYTTDGVNYLLKLAFKFFHVFKNI